MHFNFHSNLHKITQSYQLVTIDKIIWLRIVNLCDFRGRTSVSLCMCINCTPHKGMIGMHHVNKIILPKIKNGTNFS